jgi:hypothetical protein
MKVDINIKNVYLPKAGTEDVPIMGKTKGYVKPSVKLERQIGLVSMLIIDSINNGAIDLLKYEIRNGDLYIFELEYKTEGDYETLL